MRAFAGRCIPAIWAAIKVIAREIDVEDVGPVTARERPDVALVGLGASSEHALNLTDKIVRETACGYLHA